MEGLWGSEQILVNLADFFLTKCNKVTALLVRPVHDGRISAGSSSVVVVDVEMLGNSSNPFPRLVVELARMVWHLV